jgi:hypothetical protein
MGLPNPAWVILAKGGCYMLALSSHDDITKSFLSKAWLFGLSNSVFNSHDDNSMAM